MFSLILTGILLKGEPPDHQHMNIISKDNAGFLNVNVKHVGVQETMTLCRKTPWCACQVTLVRAVYFSCRESFECWCLYILIYRVSCLPVLPELLQERGRHECFLPVSDEGGIYTSVFSSVFLDQEAAKLRPVCIVPVCLGTLLNKCLSGQRYFTVPEI